MEPPAALYLECPTCGRTPHRIVRGRFSRGKELVLDGVVRCLQCGFTRHETYREGVAREVPFVISDGAESVREIVELLPEEAIRVGERLETSGGTVEVTAIEVEGRRVDEAPVQAIDTVWSKRVGRIPVKFSLNKGSKTLTFTLEVPPEEEFAVGDLVTFGREQGVIHRLKTAAGVVRTGASRADQIRRGYCRAIRHTRSGGRGGRRGR